MFSHAHHTIHNKPHVAIVGGSGKLGRYMIDESLMQGYRVTVICRPQSVTKLALWEGLIDVVPAYTDDQGALTKALADVDAVLTVMVCWGVNGYATHTVEAVLNAAPKEARLVFSGGWHLSRDGLDQYPLSLRCFAAVFGSLARWLRFADLRDQERAAKTVFESGRDWTLVRGSDLEEGESEGLPVWAEHVGDPRIAHNRVRRIDFAKFMVAAIKNTGLSQKAPAIASTRLSSQRFKRLGQG
ncbi:NAD(P)-dependent oxidoreductase [Rhodanobacter aciditrophus]|uniref:NAD(P)-dependent oxidoreductase n=1 Tax=Rhodanobacter aciditrophus TaxID=1623218 RepID=A0ABW4AZ59_9GAMM